MRIARSREELSSCLSALRADGARTALVPTMGALHAGHLALLHAAHEAVRRPGARGVVAASIFVNPLQFGDAGDLARYPRDEAGDAAQLEQAGCDLLWMPDVRTMYPQGDATTITVGGPAEGFEGAARPGHFRGVATVVAKLFGQMRPDFACFGEKDFQQLQVIKRMVRDLLLPVSIIGVPTCREPDGLAMSSRNRFLSAAERKLAPRLFGALDAARLAISGGAAVPHTLGEARRALEAAGFAFEYLALVSQETLITVDVAEPGARLIAAARLGSVRLLDNVALSATEARHFQSFPLK